MAESEVVVGNKKVFGYLALAAAILIYLVIVLGGIVHANGAASICPDWPTCRGSLLPPLDSPALLDYIHRLFTLLAVPAVLAVVALGRKLFSSQKLVAYPLYAAFWLMASQVLLGGILNFSLPLGWQVSISAIHLGLSLLVLAMLLLSTVVILFQSRLPFLPSHLSFHTPFARLSLLTLSAVFILLISGAVLNVSGAASACPGWPLCNNWQLPQNDLDWISLFHRLVVAGSALLVFLLIWQAWKTQRSQTVVLVASTAAGALYLSLALTGSVRAAQGYPIYMTSLHEAASTAIWAVFIVQAAAVGLSGRSREAEDQDAAYFSHRSPFVLAREILLLMKPIVVLLLLVTTYAGMVIAGRALPPFWLSLWTLVGGALAAGGSGAINQYIDRFDDTRMQRTEKRPIPAGRLTPAEGLAIGVTACILAFFLLVALVNLLAALLSLAGMLYYVLLYSSLLKKATPKNIVIGGGAGSLPPLVGWAAVTGSLNIPSLFLFAIVFLWTPPHFWSLAYVRCVDYARAGVPMLPVVCGERETRRQILIYTVELVALTLLLPLVGLGSGLYLVVSAALGVWLLLSAVQLWRLGGDQVAWKMYRSSSMYLAILFFALMLDRLVQF